MHAPSIDTPRYVLLDAQRPTGPPLVATSGPQSVVIYGFSDKLFYDHFCASSQSALKPYPLVKGFLRNQIEEPGTTDYLIAIDAAGPTDAHLNAATMGSVLEAQEAQSSQVAISFRLVFDAESNAYHVEKLSPAVELAV